MRQRQITVVLLVALLLLLIVSCGPEIDAPELGEAPDSTPETSANAAPARAATTALALSQRLTAWPADPPPTAVASRKQPTVTCSGSRFAP